MNITVTKTTHPGTLPPADTLGFGSVSPTTCSSWIIRSRQAGTMPESYPTGR